jgi:hypothetical protein
MENWKLFVDHRFSLQFRYPLVTPQARVVDIEEEETSDFVRVHLISRNSPEVYFEVRRYRDLHPRDDYRRHKAYLEKRFAEDAFTITELTDYSIAGAAGQQYSFQWDSKQRVAILVPHEPVTYRIIYDPVSPINRQILSTVELIP